jgi:LemA protein
MSTEDKLKKRYSREELEKIVKRAEELYSKDKQAFDHEILTATADDLDIPQEYIKKAINDLKQEKTIQEKKQNYTKIALAAGIICVLVIAVVIWFAIQSRSPQNMLSNMKDQYYNTLVNLDENIKNKRAQLENVIERRFELIPKLTEVVREYAQLEKEILQSLTQAQTSYKHAKNLEQKTEALTLYNNTISSFIETADKIKLSKANQLYQDLLFEIAGSDNRIAVERKRYNEAVSEYNKLVRQSPLNEYVEELGFDIEKSYW